MSSDLISIYMKDVEKYPLLSVSEEKALVQKAATGDKAAKDKLINSNLRIVVKLANNFTNRGVDLEDLISEGNNGLIRAINKIDPNKEVRVITYASYWINQYMKAAIYSMGRVVSIPQNRPEELKKLSWQSVSLDKAIKTDDPEGLTLISSIPDERNDNPEEAVIKQEYIEDLQESVDNLPLKESFVLIHHYGLNGYKPMGLREIGLLMNLSREGVRQIEARALVHLRQVKELQGFCDAA